MREVAYVLVPGLLAASELHKPFFDQMLVLGDQPPQLLGRFTGQRFAYSLGEATVSPLL
jgi:hypothetical protein